MAQRLANGSQFDTFHIVRLIDKGGMGEVYEAYEDLLHRKVALKIIAIDGQDNTDGKTIPDVTNEIIDLFIKEGRALAKLNHPNVVTIYRLGFAQGMHYIVMEYVEGVSLQTLINKKEIDKTQILRFFEKILRGTKAFHDKNIIHRDLKPRNILVTKENNIKIVDFGIAETNLDSKKDNKNKKVIGSTHYIPPEVLRGERPTFQSDIWNLGVLLYEILTYDKPHDGSSEKEISKKTKEHDVSFSFTNRLLVPSQLQKIILKMCQREPQDRYESVQDIMDDFLQYVETLRAQFPTANTRGEPPLKKSNNKVAYITIGLVFVAFIGLVKYAQMEKNTLVVPEPPEEQEQIASEAAPESPAEPEQVAAPTPAKEDLVENKVQVRKKKTASQKRQKHTARSPRSKQIVQKPVAKKSTIQKLASSKPIAHKPAAPKPVAQPIIERSVASVAPVTIEKLLVPRLSSPIDKISIPNQGTIVTPIVFNWSKIDGAKNYQIEFSMTKDFKQTIYEITITHNQHIFDQPLSPGTIFWRVRAIGENGNNSTWSEPRTFIIDQ